jgi:hypothetical protein
MAFDHAPITEPKAEPFELTARFALIRSAHLMVPGLAARGHRHEDTVLVLFFCPDSVSVHPPHGGSCVDATARFPSRQTDRESVADGNVTPWRSVDGKSGKKRRVCAKAVSVPSNSGGDTAAHETRLNN